MSKTIERLRKRRCYPIEIDGETINVRALLTSEQTELLKIKDHDESFGYAIGCALVNDDRSPVFTQSADETAVDFGARVLAEIDLPTDTRAELTDLILKLTAGPKSLETVVKN